MAALGGQGELEAQGELGEPEENRRLGHANGRMGQPTVCERPTVESRWNVRSRQPQELREGQWRAASAERCEGTHPVGSVGPRQSRGHRNDPPATYKPNGPDSFVVVLREGNKDLVELKRPDLPFFVAQLKHVQDWADLRDERALEVLAQIDNQYAFIAAATGLNVSRMPWTMEWLTIGIQFTVAVEMMLKHALGCFRPVHLSPQVQPIITTPGHGTYPMGHAAQAFVTIVALRGLLGIPDRTKPMSNFIGRRGASA